MNIEQLMIDKLSTHLDVDREEVKLVWFSKVLKNWKGVCVVLGHLEDGKYYEITHNGDTHKTYLDTYTKQTNETI